MKTDLVWRRDVYEMLNGIGGCDAEDEYFKGWDKAIDGAISELDKVPSAGDDLIRRSDVMNTLAAVFKQYNHAFEPDSPSKYRGAFSIAVPEAIRGIPAATKEVKDE